ncbi:MAG: hypothetical protein DVB26_05990 [Verrucomicrobia bacterium]|nr:MAG: hypothetical protein DVB26_05990 [Verrucomicrobiota bacterium]
MVISWVALGVALAEEAIKIPAWTPLKIQASAFSSDLGMLDAERQEYATNLANCAATGIVQAKGSPNSLEEARRLLTLALNLSPRNKRSLIINFQLGKGVLPEVAKGDYSPQVLARLLLTRGQLLTKQESPENLLLARMFFQLAAELDSKNEDAVYASEVDRLDHGNVDWTLLTRARPTPELAPAPEKESVKEPVKEAAAPKERGPRIGPQPRP